LPIDFTPIRFASWMGGDRDGNGFVTPTVTHEVSKRQRHQAARLLREDMKELYAELAICKGVYALLLCSFIVNVTMPPASSSIFHALIALLM
jgi:phosphoenolpyruvate carboxylase